MTGYNHKSGKLKTDATVAVDRAFIARINISASEATAASNTSVHAAVALKPTTQDVVTDITNPTYPRNIIVKGNASGMVGNVVVTGTNFNDDVITETIALNGSSSVTGSKAFKTVTKIALPIQTNGGTDTVSIGTGEVLGLPYKLSHNTVLKTYLDNTAEGTAPTVTTSDSAIESNTIDLNSTLNSKVVDVYLMV